jgi:hypothetical protein
VADARGGLVAGALVACPDDPCGRDRRRPVGLTIHGGDGGGRKPYPRHEPGLQEAAAHIA